ncbi:hypothetical protein AX13_15205 [Comamonas aquatica DA1877]|uniref:Uncharacterized protein n=1 Tax=Comamonas aquatica DA1877 TaxID=1457173 RepID=A0A014MFW4_9BURK|nr:hypothetical protein AX13_15205 [Comamonas aquatica DA1877]
MILLVKCILSRFFAELRRVKYSENLLVQLLNEVMCCIDQ